MKLQGQKHSLKLKPKAFQVRKLNTRQTPRVNNRNNTEISPTMMNVNYKMKVPMSP